MNRKKNQIMMSLKLFFIYKSTFQLNWIHEEKIIIKVNKKKKIEENGKKKKKEVLQRKLLENALDKSSFYSVLLLFN